MGSEPMRYRLKNERGKTVRISESERQDLVLDHWRSLPSGLRGQVLMRVLPNKVVIRYDCDGNVCEMYRNVNGTRVPCNEDGAPTEERERGSDAQGA